MNKKITVKDFKNLENKVDQVYSFMNEDVLPRLDALENKGVEDDDEIEEYEDDNEVEEFDKDEENTSLKGDAANPNEFDEPEFSETDVLQMFVLKTLLDMSRPNNH